MSLEKNIYEVNNKFLGQIEIPETLQELGEGLAVGGANVVKSMQIKSPRLFFGDDVASTHRVTTLAAQWATGLGLGSFIFTDGVSGYFENVRDANDANYFDGVAEVGLRAGAANNETMIASSAQYNRYRAGHLSYFGGTYAFHSESANGGFELMVGAFIRGALSEGRNDEIKDGMIWGQESADGITKRFIFRVYKNFTVVHEDEFTPIWNIEELTIFEQLMGYYGIHPAILDVVLQIAPDTVSKERAFTKVFNQATTHTSNPNLAIGVMIRNKGNTNNIFIRNGSIEFGNYITDNEVTDPTARDITHTISVASITVDADYTDKSGLLGAYTVPDVLNMVYKYEAGIASYADFTSTITNSLKSVEAVGTANKPLYLNIDLLPKSAVVLVVGQEFTQLEVGRNALSFATAAKIDTINFSERIDATIKRTINTFDVLDLSKVGSDLTSEFVAVLSLSSTQTVTASDVSISVITKDNF